MIIFNGKVLILIEIFSYIGVVFMFLKVVINGFGCIGCLVFCVGLNYLDLIEFVGINDLVLL